MNIKLLSAISLTAFLSLQTAVGGNAPLPNAGIEVAQLSERHTFLRFTPDRRYLLLPVEEAAEIAHVNVLVNNHNVQSFNIKLAAQHVDYYVPLAMTDHLGKPVVLDITLPEHDPSKGGARWSDIRLSDTFDTANREPFRPRYHHTPVYGWMNDPNGMFYKDGVYHLYYQHNPYGSQWENMTWGHSTSTDLLHWKAEGDAIVPDDLGTIFSGSCVVDHKNTAGFGAGAVVAFYTSAGKRQTQSMAYSTDNGRTFTKWAANPVVTFATPDFRDPKVIWHEGTQRWVMVLAAGQEMQFYTSPNLKDWSYASSFGTGYGNHGGVWECPDLFELPVRGTKQSRWVLLCSINPGGPFGGSATQYFVGSFDGQTFQCESAPGTTKWMDYGKDYYATVTFDNAPHGRRIALGWMSNWQYANQVPTKQFRSANTLPTDLGLYRADGEHYLARIPSPELLRLRNARERPQRGSNLKFDPNGGAYELVWQLPKRKTATLRLTNARGESVLLTCDAKAATLSVDRTKSGTTNFSADFPAVTTAPLHLAPRTLRIFVDHSSIEVLDADGGAALTNLVFPTTPYDQVQASAGSVTLHTVQF